MMDRMGVSSRMPSTIRTRLKIRTVTVYTSASKQERHQSHLENYKRRRPRWARLACLATSDTGIRVPSSSLIWQHEKRVRYCVVVRELRLSF